MEPDTKLTAIRTGPAFLYGVNIPQERQDILLKAQSMETSPSHRLESGTTHQLWEDRRPTPPLSEPRSPNIIMSRSEQASLKWRKGALDAARIDVFKTLTRSGDRHIPKTATLNIAATQRLVIAQQQRDISIQVAKLYAYHDVEASDAIVDRLREHVRNYCTSAFRSSSKASLTPYFAQATRCGISITCSNALLTVVKMTTTTYSTSSHPKSSTD